MDKLFRAYYQSTIGVLELVASTEALTNLDFIEQMRCDDPKLPMILQQSQQQLSEYFAGQRTTFDLPLAPAGTPFQQQVWQALSQIPCGQTMTYGELAAQIGKPNAYRAVGNANGKNKISLIIPCHRLVGSDGTLTGYGGGLWRKEWLLAHELRMMSNE